MTKYTTGFLQAIEGAGILSAIVLLFMTFESRAATLNWVGHGGDGFNIYCADQNTQQYTKVATTTATTTTVTECAVKSQWYVTAFNSVGESDPSNIGYLDLSLPGTPVLTTSACPVCETAPPSVPVDVYKVAPFTRSGVSYDRPLYQVVLDTTGSYSLALDSNGNKIATGEKVPANTACEGENLNPDKSSSVVYMRVAGHNGAAVCKK